MFSHNLSRIKLNDPKPHIVDDKTYIKPEGLPSKATY